MGKTNSIKTFFRQTFRRHSGAEYSELLTRGMREEQGVNRKYPWAYVRMFALIFVLFAVFLLIVRFTSNELFVPTITVLASVCLNLTFLLFIYELYPEKNLSFMTVCLVMLIGGAGANVFSQILYTLVKSTDPWVRAVISGFFEELPKAAAAVLAIVIARKSSPLAGFVFGAAVGCGFSISEDMGYIFVQANELPAMNLQTIIEVSVIRGLSALCTHTLWTAAIGWAYSHFSRHLANVAVYLVTLLSCGLHMCWDFPVGIVATGFIYAGCTIVACVECILILHFERLKVFKAASAPTLTNGEQLSLLNDNDFREEEESLSKSNPLYWQHWGNVAITLGTVLMAVIAVIYCSIPFRETYGTQTFKNAESFVSFMQNGKEIKADKNRFYDEHAGYSSKTEIDDVLVRVVQRETVDGITYNYEYSVTYDPIGEKNHYFIAQVWITIEDANGVNSYFMDDVYNDGKHYASYFPLNGDVTGYNIASDGSVTVFIYNPAFERNLKDWKYMSLFCTFAGIFSASVVCYFSLLIKSWRVKKLCSTNSVCSVK